MSLSSPLPDPIRSSVRRLVLANLSERSPLVLAEILAACPESWREDPWWQLAKAQYERQLARWPAALAALEQLIAHGDPLVAPLALALRGMIRDEQCRPEARTDLEQALALLPADAERERAITRHWLACHLLDHLAVKEAETAFAESRQAFARLGDRRGEIRALTGLADIACLQGRLPEAERTYRQAVGQIDELGLPGQALLLHNLAVCLEYQGRYDEAMKLLDQALTITMALGLHRDRTRIHRSRTMALLHLGETERARQELGHLQAGADRQEDPLLQAEHLVMTAEWERRHGAMPAAMTCCEKALTLMSHHGLAPSWHVLTVLAETMVDAGQHEDAAAILEDMIGRLRAEGMRWWLAMALRTEGRLWQARDPRRSAAALAESRELCDVGHFRLPTIDRPPIETVQPHLTITCFDRLQVQGPGGVQPDWHFQGTKTRLLLALLAVTPGGWSREALSDELFVERSVNRNALAMTVNRLRRALAGLAEDWPTGGIVVSAGGHYRLNPALRLRSDVTDFDAAAARFEQADDEVLRLEAAQGMLDRYTGHLLPEFSDSHRLAVGRSLRQRQWQQAHSWLQRYHLDGGRPSVALDLADANLALDPVAEVAHRFKMAAYGRLGMHDAARRQYHLLCRLLRQDLGLAPSPETAALARELGLAGTSAGEPLDFT